MKNYHYCRYEISEVATGIWNITIIGGSRIGTYDSECEARLVVCRLMLAEARAYLDMSLEAHPPAGLRSDIESFLSRTE